ncbi:MAG: hypothetical protein ABII24_02185 [bacterium]
MNEQFKGENIPPSETNRAKEDEARLHNALREAMDEEDGIMAEMDKVFESTPDRGEAEKIILEKWAPLMDAAVKKSSELTTQWLEAMKKSQEVFEKGK